MKFPEIDAGAFLSGMAMTFLGIMSGALLFFPIPERNHDAVTYILGVFSGVATNSGVHKMRDSIKVNHEP